jgi:hypothetical protein
MRNEPYNNRFEDDACQRVLRTLTRAPQPER